MPIANRSKTFPTHIDRLHFSSWLSGFVDGEGHFELRRRGRSRRDGIRTPAAGFRIEVREDDRKILEIVHSFFGCGKFYHLTHRQGNPSVRLGVP